MTDSCEKLAKKPLTQALAYEALVAAVLATLRRQAKIPQTEMAQVLNIKPASLSKIESGKMSLTVEELYLMAKRLDITPLRILTLVDQLALDRLTKSLRVKPNVRRLEAALPPT